MCDEAVRNKPWALRFVSHRFKTQKVCEKAVEKDLYMLRLVPDPFKTQKNV